MGAAGRTTCDPASAFCDFGAILGLHVESSLVTQDRSSFFSELVPRIFVVANFESKSGRLGIPKRGFRKEGIAKANFSQKSFVYDFSLHGGP